MEKCRNYEAELEKMVNRAKEDAERREKSVEAEKEAAESAFTGQMEMMRKEKLLEEILDQTKMVKKKLEKFD